ncbi:general stress protein [Paeniglutamicibacter sp. Y32M11]|uniref:general stress protein n=1 Tax=Paeniglutamicibacter sp. Y32M11 TaxID=2853258 RepID=UPI001C528592|nr:general stress protein [Paeniglutamicibacter sp. Y32M11]QXQ09168.1 ECF transporter S component [Paeniglutamicibacter sp. Y32M11]
MSSPLGASPSNSNTLGLPRGELLGRYSTYLDAQKVVDYLADNDFPVSHLTIVGNDLKSVERVTAKLSYPKVALAGAAQGAMFGIFVGLVLTIFSPGANPLAQILSSVGIGMAIWMLVGVVSYSFRRGKRDFASQSQVLATNYDVVVAFSHAHAARALAAKLPMSQMAADAGVGAHHTPVAQHAPTAPTAAPATTPAPTAAIPETSATGSYSDLPDGRPQFGIRIQDERPAVVAVPETESAADKTPDAVNDAENEADTAAPTTSSVEPTDTSATEKNRTEQNN